MCVHCISKQQLAFTGWRDRPVKHLKLLLKFDSHYMVPHPTSPLCQEIKLWKRIIHTSFQYDIVNSAC